MRRRTLSQVAVCLAAIVAAFALPGTAPARESVVAPHRVAFTVQNPAEDNATRTVVGNRYDPACKASTVVLLQHGLSYHKEAWDFPGYSVAQPFVAAGYAVVSIDRLGYGESPLEDGYDVTFEAFADMANQIVGQLRSEFDHVVMGGHSAGAGLSEFAQGIYGSADAILALGWHHRPSDQLGFEFITGDSTRALQDDYEYFWGTPEHRAEMFYEPDADPAVVEADTRAANLVPSGEILTISKQPSRYVAGNVRVPVFLQFGEKDRLFEPQYADFHAAALGDRGYGARRRPHLHAHEGGQRRHRPDGGLGALPARSSRLLLKGTTRGGPLAGRPAVCPTLAGRGT